MSNRIKQPKLDQVDVILKQWQKERPDLDSSPMGPIGRIKRCAFLLEKQLESKFEMFDLTLWEFDMLATLRRSGAPFCLSPTELFSLLMVTSGTMTHRLKKLENKNLIIRVLNEQDGRSMLVQLTDQGLKLIDHVVEQHIENEREILSVLPAHVLEELDNHLSSLLVTLELTTSNPTSADKVKNS